MWPRRGRRCPMLGDRDDPGQEGEESIRRREGQWELELSQEPRDTHVFEAEGSGQRVLVVLAS